jgi:hypothetical protein
MPKYITKDQYREFTGIDLGLELRDLDDSSNKVNIFINSIENWCETFLAYHSTKELNLDELSDKQKKHYTRAIMYQIQWVLRNGDISSDSGYDPNQGPVVDVSYLRKITLAPNALMEFNLAGVLSRKVRTQYGYRYPFF